MVQRWEEDVSGFRRLCVILTSLVVFLVNGSFAADEPQGLILRKGPLNWQTSLEQARPFIEQNIHPNTLRLLANQPQEGFRCEREAVPGVSHCVWACCVDLGEPDTVHFATIWFFEDRFYSYDVAFNTGQFPRLFEVMTAKYGKPTSEEQASRFNPALAIAGMGMRPYIVNTKRWDLGNSVVLLSDRGGEGKPLVGHVYVAYMPILRQTVPAKKEEAGTGARLPF